MRKVFITFLPTIFIALLSFFAVYVPLVHAFNDSGSITICKALSDQNGNVVDGSQAPGTTFTISGFVPSPVPIDGIPAGALPTSSFSTPLTLNAKVFSESSGNDSQCVTYSNLPLGAYYYGQETISSGQWTNALYNDQYTSIVSRVTDVFPYDGSLFAADQSTVASRNQNADGSIVLTEYRPTRTLVVVNSLISAANTNGGSSSGGSSGGVTPYVCNDSAPTSAPAITNVILGTNSVTLNWTKAQDPVSYYLVAYGTKPGVYTFGNPNIGGHDTTSYTINDLSGGTTYFFVVRAGNGCKPGPFSNEVSATPGGTVLSTQAEGFSQNVLGSTNASKNSDFSTFGAVCAACLWSPFLLGEIAVLFGYLVLLKRKIKKFNTWLVSGFVAIGVYVAFLLFNKNCVGEGVMHIIIWAIPCKYFWAIDTLIAITLTWLLKKRKLTLTK